MTSRSSEFVSCCALAQAQERKFPGQRLLLSQGREDELREGEEGEQESAPEISEEVPAVRDDIKCLHTRREDRHAQQEGGATAEKIDLPKEEK